MTAPDRESRGTSNAIPRPETDWPEELASIGAIRFGRTYYHYEEAVHFFRDLVGLPLYEQFEGSYGENGSIFGLPSSAVTFEVVQATEPTPIPAYDALCLYFPDQKAQQAAMSRLKAAGLKPSESHRTGSQPAASPTVIPTADRSYLRHSSTARTNLRAAHPGRILSRQPSHSAWREPAAAADRSQSRTLETR